MQVQPFLAEEGPELLKQCPHGQPTQVVIPCGPPEPGKIHPELRDQGILIGAKPPDPMVSVRAVQ